MKKEVENMKRRDVLLTAAAMTTVVASTVLGSSEHNCHNTDKKIIATPTFNRDMELIDAALHCVKNGQVCNDHCIALVKQGDTSIADCLASVSDMLVTCAGLSKLASNESAHLKAYAKVCIAVCRDCEKACAKHENHHAECKACAESCRACIKACERAVA